MRRLLRYLGAALWRTNTRRLRALLAGMGAGAMVVGTLDPFLAAVGYVPEATAALVLVAGGILAWLARGRGAGSGRRSVAFGLVVLGAGWSVAGWWTSAIVPDSLALLPYAWLENSLVRLLAMVAAAAAVPGPVLALVVRWPVLAGRGSDSAAWRTHGLGLCLGTWTTVAWLAPAFGSWPVLCAAAGTIVALTAFALWQPSKARFEPCADEPGDEAPSRLVERRFAAALVGVASACVARMTFELLMPTAALLHLAWLAPLFGLLAVGRRTRRLPEWGAALAAGWVGLLAVLHGPIVEGVLWFNAHAESLWLQTLGHSAIVLALGAPMGLAWGLLRSPHRAHRGGTGFESPAVFACGFVLGTSVASVFGEAATSAALAVCVGTCIVARRLLTWQLPAARWRRLVIYGTTAFLLAGPWWANAYRPDRSAKLLFSTSVVVAERSGVDRRLREHADGSRLVEVRPGPHGTHTVWSRFGVQRELRTGGIPVGVASRAPDLCPNAAIETAVAAIPLVLHEAPRNVLLLGLDDGVPLATVLEFPVLEVRCAEADRTRVALLRSAVWEDVAGVSPLADDRVRLVPVDPRWAAACDPRRYDVVISNPSHPALARVAPSFTRAFYAGCRARLAEGGVFCQRLRTIDFGAGATADLLVAFRSAFPAALVLGVTPGEMLLLGANERPTLWRADLAERLSPAHVRSVLARCGWDWSIPLMLATLDDDALEVFAVAHGTRHPAESGRAYRLANETRRWGTKFREQSLALQQVAIAFGDHLPQEDARLVDGRARIADLNRAREIQRSNPDEWWAYRGVLKQMLQSQPRSTIQMARGTGMHPVDRRRLDFLVSLGEAYAVRPPNVADVHRLLEHAREGDPMIEFFARAEATRLFSDCPERLPREELEQRLWLVLHGDGADRSIRNVAHAIELIVARPEAIPDAADRWEVLDGLLQTLADRWDARARHDPLPTPVLRRDIAITLEAQRGAFAAMQAMADAKAVPHVDWTSRAAYLVGRIVRPLKTYRERLRAHEAAEADRRERAAPEDG